MALNEQLEKEIINKIRLILSNSRDPVKPSEIKKKLELEMPDISSDLIARLAWRMAADGVAEITQDWKIKNTQNSDLVTH